MKVYLAIAFDTYYPRGGLYDCEGISLTEEGAWKVLEGNRSDYCHVCVIDTDTCKWDIKRERSILVDSQVEYQA